MYNTEISHIMRIYTPPNPVVQSECPMCPVCPSCPQNQVRTEYSQQPQFQGQFQDNINIDIQQPNIQQPGIIPPVPPITSNPIREYDYRALKDPLVPPYKRSDYGPPLPSYPTRGFPAGFRKMGTLIDETADNNDPYKFMILVGRQTYYGSNMYDYYVTDTNKEQMIKFDLQKKRKEIMTDDKVYVVELKKTYTAKIDRNVGFDYNPFVI